MIKNNILSIYKILLKEFDEQGWWPINGVYSIEYKHREKTPKEKFEIIVGVILTQSTNWNNVEKAIKGLKKNKKFNKKSILELSKKDLAELIKSSGYNVQKARKLKEFFNFKRKINRKNLLSIWGIGNETADSILLYAFNEPIFVIDSYTKRIFSRIGLCAKNIKYEKLQDLFHENLSKDYKIFNEYHALIVELAKKYCKKTPNCASCPIRKKCDYYRKN